MSLGDTRADLTHAGETFKEGLGPLTAANEAYDTMASDVAIAHQAADEGQGASLRLIDTIQTAMNLSGAIAESLSAVHELSHDLGERATAAAGYVNESQTATETGAGIVMRVTETTNNPLTLELRQAAIHSAQNGNNLTERAAGLQQAAEATAEVSRMNPAIAQELIGLLKRLDVIADSLAAQTGNAKVNLETMKPLAAEAASSSRGQHNNLSQVSNLAHRTAEQY